MKLLHRTLFETSRTAEYFDLRELQAQTGQPANNFATVVLKELCDNALDAAEASGIPPEVTINIETTPDTIHIDVKDNGPGIPADVIKRILNFQTRSSDKAAYRSPTRGMQGNALKTVIGIPSALWCNDVHPVTIDSLGTRHQVKAWIDPSGELRIDHKQAALPDDFVGTSVSVVLPPDGQQFVPTYDARAFALFNPHALVKIWDFKTGIEHGNSDDDEILNSYHPTVDAASWRKYLPTDLSSAYWYDNASLTKLVFCHIADARRGGRDLTLREFVRQFRGLSGTSKAKAVCDQFIGISRLSDLEGKRDLIPTILEDMRTHSKAPSPDVLGFVGENHFRTCFDDWYGIKNDRFWYKRCSAISNGIPFIFEIAVARVDNGLESFHGVNFSPTFDDPLTGTHLSCTEIESHGTREFLRQCYADPILNWNHSNEHTAAAIHLVCPALQFMDRGKSRLQISHKMASEISETMWKALKVLYHEGKRREKDAARSERREQEKGQPRKLQGCSMKEAVFEVLPAAVKKATGGGSYPVSARTLYYQVRPLIQAHTLKELEYRYFSQELLTQYKETYGSIDGLYYDPRGILYEPHTGKSIPLGTREVEAYQFPPWRYNKILYVEKKGLWPVLQAARLAERYDLAVIAAEGYATEAARTLFSQADKGQGYQLFVLHDADPHGYNIARTLQEETRRMKGYDVKVIDLGLRIEEALALDLQTETFTRQKALPEGLKLTDKERDFFEGRKDGKSSWICKRVELNALNAPQFIEFIERKLGESGASGKVIPSDEALPTLAEELYMHEMGRFVERFISTLLSEDKIKESIIGEVVPDYGKSRGWIKEAFASDNSQSWDYALRNRFGTFIGEQKQLVRAKIRDMVFDAVHRM